MTIKEWVKLHNLPEQVYNNLYYYSINNVQQLISAVRNYMLDSIARTLHADVKRKFHQAVKTLFSDEQDLRQCPAVLSEPPLPSSPAHSLRVQPPPPTMDDGGKSSAPAAERAAAEDRKFIKKGKK